ncbi:MAG: hypothetical protein ACI9DH_000834 [Halioglobus sp.]|jgi:hypothetical protein
MPAIVSKETLIGGENKTSSRFAIVFIAVVLEMLTACAKVGPEQNLTIYIERLERTLQEEAPAPVEQLNPTIPKTSELILKLPSSNLGTLDFLSLSGCAVQITIGKRNSSLGIMASDSQRLLLELEYLEHAPQCIQHMRELEREALATLLEEAFILKRQQLPSLVYNATLANTEFRQFWKKPNSLKDYPQQTSSAVLSALNAITEHVQRWLGGDYTANNLEFEILLSEISKGDGGALLEALGKQKSHLAAANALLKRKLTSGPLCSEKFRDSAADVLPNVIQKFFILEVQPWSADLGRRYYELLPAISKLEELLSEGLPETYEYWRQQRTEAFSAAVKAPRDHVGLLKETLDSCGSFGNLT